MLLSQEDKGLSSSSTTSLEESIKRAAISPASNNGKRLRLNAVVDSLKLMVKRPDGDIDELFFEKLSHELVAL